jgi:hypothetical protein
VIADRLAATTPLARTPRGGLFRAWLLVFASKFLLSSRQRRNLRPLAAVTTNSTDALNLRSQPMTIFSRLLRLLRIGETASNKEAERAERTERAIKQYDELVNATARQRQRLAQATSRDLEG